MSKTFLLSVALLTLSACATETLKHHNTKVSNGLNIIDRPIDFGATRIALTKAYIKTHYGKSVNSIKIVPKIIVLHWTADMHLDTSFRIMKSEKLHSNRKDIVKASALNVSTQFLVARNGQVYRLMPENWMARHVIGLNYTSIGVENVGDPKHGLTHAQEKANIALVKYLKNKYPTIQYLIGHHEYRQLEHTSLWLEKDKGYRTTKIDPGEKFMSVVRSGLKALKLKQP